MEILIQILLSNFNICKLKRCSLFWCSIQTYLQSRYHQQKDWILRCHSIVEMFVKQLASWKTCAWFSAQLVFWIDVCRGNFVQPFSICSLKYEIFVAAAQATDAKPHYWMLTARKQLTYSQKKIIYFYFEALQPLAECENIMSARTHTHTIETYSNSI